MSGEVVNYQITMKEYQRVHREAALIVSRVTRFVDGLKDWKNIAISMGAGAGDYPAELLGDHKPSLDPSDLFSVWDIHETLIAYHRAKAAMIDAYKDIPSDSRDAVITPESYIAEVEKELAKRYSR